MKTGLQPLAFSCEQTAELIQVSLGQIRKMVRDGSLRSFRVGKLWRIPEIAVMRLCGQTKQGAKKRQAKKR